MLSVVIVRGIFYGSDQESKKLSYYVQETAVSCTGLPLDRQIYFEKNGFLYKRTIKRGSLKIKTVP